MGAAHPLRPARVVVEADGGSRGNPGPAGYGALLRDGDTGDVLAEAAASIGRATNNVAEYRGLIAGLELYVDHAAGAELEVRMDSKLVIEQMAGRWRIKHADLKPLALKAQGLAPPGTTWTWVPRERNVDADRLANFAMDDAAGGSVTSAPSAAGARNAMPGWNSALGVATTLVLVRHGQTDNTAAQVFCGPGGSDPGLNDRGREEVRRTAKTLKASAAVDVVLSSPMRRARETADLIATELGLTVERADGFCECAFGAWDGLTLEEVRDKWPTELAAWLDVADASPPEGESILAAQRRVEAELQRTLSAYAGKTVVVVSHVTPIKLVVRACLDAPLHCLHRVLVAPASQTVVSFFESGDSVLQQLSA